MYCFITTLLSLFPVLPNPAGPSNRNTLGCGSYSLPKSLMLFFHRLLSLLVGVSAASLFTLADSHLPLLRDDMDRSAPYNSHHNAQRGTTPVRRAWPSGHHSARANPPLIVRTPRIRTHGDALATCAEGERVCGTYQGSSAYECVNTDTALESCGGCMSPNMFISAEEQGPDGVDCTMILHVQNVRCTAGQCVVDDCDDGFEPSLDRDRCIPRRLTVQSLGKM